MDSRLSRFCDGFLEAGWLATLITVPLFFNIHSERVFEPDKTALLRSLAVAMVLVWLVKLVDQHGWQQASRLRWRAPDSLWRVPFVLPVTMIGLVYLVASLFSITPHASWMGSYQRLQGTYTTLSYIAIFAVMAGTIQARVQVRRVVTAVIITSIPVSFYGLLQHFGLDPLPWGGDVAARVAGHMGNAIFIAAYLIMVLPLTLARIVDAFTNILGDEELSYADVVRATVYVLVLGMQLLTIYWSGSRGPLIGLGVGLFSFMLVLLVSLRNTAVDSDAVVRKEILAAFVVVLPPLLALVFANTLIVLTSPTVGFAVFAGALFFSGTVIFLLIALRKGWTWLWLSWLFLVLIAAGWLLLFNVPAERTQTLARLPVVGGIFEAQSAWKELPTIGSYGRMLDPTQSAGREKSNRVRVLIWEGVIDLISPHAPLTYPDESEDRYNFLRPLIGYGPEAMYVAYNRFYPPELATVEARNASPDRAHNETFDALVITGLAGFLAWQALYIAVFYYGFSFLGVVRSKRDRTVLFACWIGGGLLGALLSLTAVDSIYLGVAVPTGTVLGLILYLFYYALLARPSVQTAEADGAGAAPFMVDRLLVNALLAAVLAHYVEIHFGIAISATRLHFFVYAALLLVLVYKLPQLRAAEAARRAEQSAYQKDGQRPLSKEKFEKSPWVGVWPWAFLLALMIGILGFEFMNYALPPDKVVQTGADLGAGDIFWQSLFLNAQRGFLDSPFIYLMIVLSWFLGVLVVLSEAVRYQDYFLSLPKLSPVKKLRNRVAAALFLLLGFAGVAQRFVGPAASGAREALGQSLGLLAAMVALAVALQLLRTPENGRFTAVAVALGGLAFSLPLGVAGSWEVAVGLGFVCLLIVYLLWDAQLRPYVVPPLALAVLSFAIGMAYAYMQAVLLREALLYLVFFQGIEPLSTLYQLFFRPAEAVNSIEQARVLEALQAGHLLTGFYGFLFGMQALAGAALARLSAGPVRVKGTAVGYGAAIVALFAGLIFIMQSNVRPVQADMVFKRARPFDEQAGQQRDPAVWNNAIAIYEQALGMAPAEDYYSLFLGRAYLERSALAESREAQAGLLRKAEEVLTNAEALNPLNTDHLANLARLNARWAAAVAEDAQHEERLALAEAYYRKALISSPQNSIIRNEYARLLFDLRRTCDGAIAVYEDSLAVDPFFVSTYFDYADVLIACAAAQADAEAQQALSRSATVILEAGLERDPERLRGWLQLGQAFQEGGQYEEAVAALARARSLSEDSGLPTWNIDYLEATLYRDMGQIERARALAEQALEGAPADAAPQIESFITDLGSE